ncbi:MAG: hypothetical protein HOP14_03825, partial [Acidobacteria bacterium]|nr:hypothetical protein [Acidobacteriota bacterium]
MAVFDGELGVLEAEPDIALTVSLDAVLGSLPNLLQLDPAPSGTIAADGELSGPLGAPVATLAVRSPRLEWHGVTLADVEASTTVTTASLDMERVSFTLAGGRVDGSATIPFDATATTTVSAQITDLDVAEAVRVAAPGAAVTPSATVSGTLEASGRVPDPAGWSASLDLTARSRGNGPARVGVGGNVAVTLTDGRWRVRGDTIVADVAPVGLALDGTLERPDPPARNAVAGAATTAATGTAAGTPTDTVTGTVSGTVSGTVTVGESALDAWFSAVRAMGYTVPDAVASAMGLVQADVRLSGSLTDPAVDAAVQATGVTSPSLRVPLAEITATGRPVRRALVFDTRVPEAEVAGQSIRQLSARASWEGNQLLIDDLSAGQASGPGALRASAVFDLASSTVTGTASLTGWMVTPTPELPASAVVEGTFTAEGPLDEPTGSGTVVLTDARWDDVALGRLDVGLRLDGAGPHADVRAGALDLAAVTAGLDLPVSLSGTAAASVEADIAPADWRASRARLVIEQLEALVGRLPLRLEGTATAVYDNGALHVDPLTVRAEGVTVEASGDVQAFAARQPGTAAPGLQAVVRGTVEDVLAAVAASGVSTVTPVGGTGSLTLAAVVTGALDAPRIAVDLDAGPAVVNLEGLPPLSEVVVRARLRDGWAEVDRLEAAFEGARVDVAGRVPAAWILDRTAPVTAADGAASLEGRATGVSPQVLVPFVGEGILDGVEGGLDLALSLTSASPALRDLRGELRVERLDLAVADLPIRQVVPTRIIAEDGFARVADWQWTGEGLTLGLQGQVRLEDRQAAVLANGVVDLRLLSPFVRDSGVATAGRLETRLSVTGTLDAPRIDGDLRVSNGVVALADPRVQVSDLDVRALVSRSGAQITSLTGSLNGGMLTGGGTAMLGDEGGVRADLTLTVREAALEVPDGLRSEVDADLAFSVVREPGDVRPEGRLSGDVTIRRSAYREQVTLITGLFAGLGRPTLPSPTEGPTLADRIALDVRVVTDEDLIVNNNYGRFELGADVRVIGTAARPALAGRAVLREGGQVFFGRNAFVVDRGTVDFSNPTAIEPSLDLEARTDVAGEQIVLTLTGTPAELESNLRSTTTPELGPSDLTSLLLTGRRLEDVPGDEAAIVSEQVLGFLSGDVLGLAGNAVGLDVLRIGGPGSAALRRDPVALATETDPSTRVTFGKSIGERLDVTVSQSLRQSAAQTWIIDYLATRRLVLRLVSDDDNLRSYELRHDVSFGGTPLLADRPREAVRRSPDVAQVRVVGADEGEADLRRRLRLRAGDRFDFIRWQDDRDRLERALQDEGFLEADVRAARTTEGEDVVLTYTVVRGPRTRIEVTGMDLASGTLARLERAWGEEVFDGFLVEQAESITRDALVGRGYLDARVDARVVEDGTDKVLALAVEPGTRWTDTRIVVTGVDPTLQDDIRTWLRSRDDPRAIWTTPAVVADEVMGFLRGLGYVRAEVEIGSPTFGDGAAVATVEVMPGPLFAIAEVEIRGTARLGLDEAEAAVDLRPDDPYAPDRVAAARDRLIARYRLRGFPEVQVGVDQRLDEAASGVGLVFDVEEGPQQVIGEVVIEGTRTIAAEDVRRALALEPDEPAGTETLLAARRRVY